MIFNIMLSGNLYFEILTLFQVLLIFGISGACRCDELTNLRVTDVKDKGDSFIVQLNDTKNYKPRPFYVGPLFYDKVKMYISLRPPNAPFDRFFAQYINGKCTCQVIGRNKIGEAPKKIATYLGLDNVNKYTGHCLRRTGTTLLANSGANMVMIKQLGGWKSDTVAQGYIEDSVTNRKKIFEALTYEAASTSKIQLNDRPSAKKNSPDATSSISAVNDDDLIVLDWDDFDEDFITNLDETHQFKNTSDDQGKSVPKISDVLRPIQKQSHHVFHAAKGSEVKNTSDNPEKSVSEKSDVLRPIQNHSHHVFHTAKGSEVKTFKEQSNVEYKPFLTRSPIQVTFNRNTESFQPAMKKPRIEIEDPLEQNENQIPVNVPFQPAAKEPRTEVENPIVQNEDQIPVNFPVSNRGVPIKYENCTFNNTTTNNYFYYCNTD